MAGRDGLFTRAMEPTDAAAVLRIYQAGLDSGLASFEITAPGWDEFDAGKLPGHRLVAVLGRRVVGWVAVSAVSARLVYSGVVEHSVYVDPSVRGRGVGTTLLAALVASTEAAGVWTIQSGVFPDNAASLSLHDRAGFRIIGTRQKVGRHPIDGWRDVLLIERRSRVAGVT